MAVPLEGTGCWPRCHCLGNCINRLRAFLTLPSKGAPLPLNSTVAGKMMVTSDINEIIETIKKRPIRIVAIDGMDGSGKTTFSKKLRRRLKCIRISLDSYLKKNAGSYLDFINYSNLQRDLSINSNLILIEGTCCLAVLARLHVLHDLLIYVKRYSPDGYWRDEDECDIQGDIDDFVDQEKGKLLRFCEADAALENKEFDPSTHQFPPFREELFRYHYKFRPHQVADIIFRRTDC